MADHPFRVCRTTQSSTYGKATVTRFAIVRSGFDPVCYCDDVTFAYRIVELLNSEEANYAQATAATDRRVYQGGDSQRIDNAAD